jgi:hypothetical protein
MKRFKVLGLCLVAVFAFTAVAVSSASATPPQYFTCLKAKVKAKGNYSDKACSTIAGTPTGPETGTGKYERGEWNQGKKVTIKGKGTNPKNNAVNPFGKEMKVGEAGQIAGTTTCSKEKLTGQVTGPKTTTWFTEYTGCEASGFKCNTVPLKEGRIKTETLESELVFLDAAKTNVGVLVKGLGAKKGGSGGATGELASYQCGPKGEPLVFVEVYGTVLAETNGNTEAAEKSTENVVTEGALKLQGIGGTYTEELFGSNKTDEEAAKGWWEYEETAKLCEAGGAPFPAGTHSRAECEAFIGKANPVPVKPDLLESIATGAQKGDGPDNQNGVTTNKGEAMGVAIK